MFPSSTFGGWVGGKHPHQAEKSNFTLSETRTNICDYNSPNSMLVGFILVAFKKTSGGHHVHISASLKPCQHISSGLKKSMENVEM